MDGFNVIPIGKDNNQSAKVMNNFQSAQSFESGIEVMDEAKELQKTKIQNRSFLLPVSLLALIGVFGYFGYLVWNRLNMMNQISDYSNKLIILGKTIDVGEMKDFQAMDTTLKAIDGKLGTHILNSQILTLVNQNIRTSLEVTSYDLNITDKNAEVNLSVVAPSFKELAEQTEKLFELKDNKNIQSFGISSLSFEQSTKRVKFSIRLLFDKSKFSALTQARATAIVPSVDNASSSAATTNPTP